MHLAPPAHAKDLSYPGIIGGDDRQAVDSAEHPWPAIGKVIVDGFSLRLFCTGVLLKPDTVVTAAHCLFNQRTGRFASAERVSFIAGVRRDEHAGHSKAKCVRVLDPSSDYRDFGIETASRDIAVITLAQALAVAPLAVAEDAPLKMGTSVSHAGYGRDRPYLPSYHRDCTITGAPQNTVASSCDTNLGQSGGPLLIRENDDWRVAAIMVGAIEAKASIAVPASVWRTLVLDPACQD